MAWPPSSTPVTAWADEFAVGTAIHGSFAGEPGLRALSGPMRVSAPAATRFAAGLTRVDLHGAVLERFEATEHAVVRGTAEIAAFPLELIVVVFVVAGALEVQVNGTTWQAGAGDSVLMDTRVPAWSSSSGGVELLRVAVRVDLVPEAARTDGVVVPGALPRTVLSSNYLAFIRSILASGSTGAAVHLPGLRPAVVEMQSAVLREARRAAGSPSGAAALRARLEARIEDHHRDPRWDVPRLARAAGISVRQAHEVFDDGEHTIDRALRDRRVATAALLIQEAHGEITLAELAKGSGFRGTDELDVAFKRNLGASPRQVLDHRRSGTD